MHTTNASATTPYQQYLGQLAEYDALLGRLRDAKARGLALAGIYLSPQPHSPLAQEHDVGQTHLHSLLRHPDYLALVEKLKIMNFLSVSTAGGRSVYKTADQKGAEVILSMTENPGWRELTEKIEPIALSMGGQLRSDKLLSLPQVLTYYALPAAQTQNTTEMESLIHKLEERRASHSLQLFSGVDIDTLNRSPTAEDRQLLKTIQRATPTSAMTIDSLLAQLTNRDIVAIVQRFLPETESSLFSYLIQNAVPNATEAQVRVTPTVVLESILRSAESERLAMALLEGLNWYGGKPGEETSSGVRIKLLSKAIRLWTNKSGNPADIAGYPWHQRSNWGKSYPSIRAEFEQHLFDSRRASSMTEAILLARLLQPEFPRAFQVPDIPPDLPYGSSVVWVNFVHGVTLAEAIEPDSIERMTFQQLVNLPIKRTDGATPEQLNLIALARLLPSLDWAVTQGVISQKSLENHSQSDIDLALSALENQKNELNEALIQLDKKPPERLAIAKTKMQSIFGEDAFISDGRKLARKGITGPAGFRDTPPLKGKEYDYYSFVDVYASGKFDDQKSWLATQSDGTTISTQWIRIDESRRIVTGERPWRKPGSRWVISPETRLPDVKALFDNDFKHYLQLTTTAYETLIRSQLASLPFADRQAIALGELRVYSLRKETRGIEAQNETPEMILPLRARNGLILQAIHPRETQGHEQGIETRYYELLPRAGVIRRIENLGPEHLGGAVQTEKWRQLKSTVSVSVLRHKTLPFDWDAHSTGSKPKEDASCQAIIEQLGGTFATETETVESSDIIPLTLSSSRCVAISHFIATQLLFTDPIKLRIAAYGQTRFELEEARGEKALEIGKMFMPFWNSIEDLASGDKTRLINGTFGLFADLLSFAQPIGKFASGSAILISNAGRLTFRARLPAFVSLTKKLLISSLQTLNPVDGIGSLLRALGARGVKLARFSVLRIKELAGKAGSYDFVHKLPQISDAGRWKPLAKGDQLATVKGIDDIHIRKSAIPDNADYHLIDPLSSRPYGPRLTTRSGDISLGRSHYNSLDNTKNHVIVEVSENSRIREVLEVDGRTTLFIDDVPYRLDGDTLRRADLIDDQAMLRSLPCRVRRAPGADVCETSYVTRAPAPTPDINSFDETKGWAPWFGDSIYTNGAKGTPMKRASIATHETLGATIEFCQGIFGRVKVSVPDRGVMDTLRAGAIIVEAADGTKRYVFTRLNASDFFVAELAKGRSLGNPLTFKQASTLSEALKEQLMVVYTGSLNANNMARIHGIEAVERAMKTMDEIAIPISVHEPNTLKRLELLKVDTSPGEAILFDHKTRMIIRSSEDGAATWSPSKKAPDSVRETTAEVFNNLFQKKVIAIQSSRGEPLALNIDKMMQQLQVIIGQKLQRPVHAPRNIAFAEIKTKAGVREIYVSVSGSKGDTGFLPMFQNPANRKEVTVDGTRYFNIDKGTRFPETALSITPAGKLQAIPHTIDNIETYTPMLTSRPTSLDTESKLISVIRKKYPDPKDLDSITIATTLAPCDSCAVVMKQFGYDGSPNALDVIWK